MIRSNWIKVAAITISAALGIRSADAGMTTVKAPPTFEIGHKEIFEHWYGGTFNKVGNDYYSGGVSAKRLDDWMSNIGVQNLKVGECGYSCDQWFNGKATVKAVAKFSGNSQNLGVICENNNQTNLFSVTGYGFNINNVSAKIDLGTDNFKFVRWGDSGTQTSCDTDNADGRDHMVTYVIEGLAGQKGPVFMMFWEDLNRTATMPMKRSWADYNDLVMEVSYDVHAIPLPPAAYAGLVTLAGVAWKRKTLAKVVRA